LTELRSPFAVISPAIDVPSEAMIEKRFSSFILQMKRNMDPNTSKADLDYNAKAKVRGLASRCHKRLLQQAGLNRLSESVRAELASLAKSGGRLLGPATLDEVDILAARLHDESPWMNNVTTFVMHHMRTHVRNGGVGLHLPPIILAGPPGIGKSWFARSIASAAGLPSRLIDVGAGGAAFRIAGTEKGWGSAQPGLPVEVMLQMRIGNPVMIVDEIDKTETAFGTKGSGSNLATALLPFLDHGTAQRFECPFTRVPFDMTRVIWVLTANDIDRISAPLRDRCLVFNLPGITPATAALFFDYLVREIDNIEELKAEASAFVAKMAGQPAGISLRQIRRLAKTLGHTETVEVLQ